MRIRLREDVSLTETQDGSAVLLDERSGQYWQLNPSGLTIVRLGMDGVADRDIARRLLPEPSAEVTVDQVVADIRELVGQLVAGELVIRS
ncbi:lasso peptide biosynthesis PqqD family chaperone [Nocardia sp. NPDC051570]|uniref:lasso peptide biosynthesis PqqD family chaperone n=1 Tax=Nocardia sp. NPDC051570 TaxID=3364324 RepID=UPI00379414FE